MDAVYMIYLPIMVLVIITLINPVHLQSERDIEMKSAWITENDNLNPDDANSRIWHVSAHGRNDSECGTIHKPCLTLENLQLETAYNNEIHIKGDGHHTFATCDNRNCDSFQFEVNGSISLLGSDIPTILGSDYGNKNTNPRNSTTKLQFIGIGDHSTVKIMNLDFQRVDIYVLNCHVIIQNCVFHSSRLKIVVNETKTDIILKDTSWYGFTYCELDSCVPSGEITVMGYFHNVRIINNVLSNTNMSLMMVSDCKVIIDRLQSTNDVKERAVESNMNILINTPANRSSIRVTNSVFEHQYHWNPVESVMNIFESALLIRYITPPPPANPLNFINNISVLIHNCTFFNNERGLTFQGPIETINITNCAFRSNIAMHAGAGILLLTQKLARIENSTFENNFAGSFRKTNVRKPGNYFKVEGDEAYVYSDCCKGSISLIGKGGAIRIQKGNISLVGCTFINNTATILGGSIFLDRNYELMIHDTQFTNGNHISTAAQQGDIIYSNGKVEINGARFEVRTAANHISLLQHSGDHWSIGVYNISIECPVGYRLRIMNTSAYQIMPNRGLLRSYMLDQLAYFCESCPRYKYSLERGYFFYNMDPGVQVYYTLLVNGQNPNSEFQGTYKYEDIVCKKCPYGGNCDNDQLKSLPNFWGYEHNGEVKFQLCPKGYCCSLKSCPSYNSCAKYRTGRLCAECQNGYSEALFSPKCIPNTSCGPIWVWFLPVGLGLLYSLLLFFQKDIRDFIFAIPAISCKDGNKSNSESLDKSIGCKNDEEKQCCLEHNCNQSSLGNKENDKTEGLHEKCFIYRDEAFAANDNNGVVQNGASQPQQESTDEIDNYGRVLIRDGGEMEESDGEEEPPPPSANDFGAIMLITILYYFQDAQLLHVKTAFAAEENPKWSLIKAILLGLFKFRIEIAHFLDSVCLMEGLSPSVKLLAKTLLVPYVLILFGILFLVYCILDKICSNKKSSAKHEDEDPEKTFMCRLAMGLMLALLFTYQMLATTAFKLLNCVPVGNDSVLFIDGTVSCYEPWQYGILIYAMTCIVPFSFVLMLGPGLLQEGRISLPTFFTACIFPFPFVITWLLLRVCKKDTWLSTKDNYPTEPGKIVIKVLQGPFKDIQNKITGPLCWAGVLIFRRLLLVLLYTFINITLLRIIAMLLICFIVLLNQVHVKPYRDSRANVAQSASIAALMFVGGINLVRAGFEAAEYTPHGPYKMLIIVMQETENTLMLWIPLVFMVIMGMILTIKISCHLVKSLSIWCNPEKNASAASKKD